MAIISCIGIKIDDNNYPAPDNVPDQQYQQQENGKEGGKLCKSEGVVCPRKANNVWNYFTFFCNYTQEEVLNMINLDIFLVLFSVGYLKNTLIQ